jgi:PHS family inorganic phosphate transporter-like MFS transporter
MGLGLVPAFATLYARLRMPEGKKYTQSKELNTSSSSSSIKLASDVTPPAKVKPAEDRKLSRRNDLEYRGMSPASASSPMSLHPETQDIDTSKYSTFFIYFSKWKHLKTLIGTASCWFLLDVAFYGTNLNQSVLLTEIGFSTGKNEYDVLFRNALGNLIIAAAGYVPGYFFTIYFIEKLGRRWIQIQGFLVCALMFGILAGDYGNLGTAPKFVCFAIAQVCLLISYHIEQLYSTLSCSSSSTSAPTQRPSSSQQRCSPLASAVSAMGSAPPSAKWVPFSRRCYSTFSVARV